MSVECAAAASASSMQHQVLSIPLNPQVKFSHDTKSEIILEHLQTQSNSALNINNNILTKIEVVRTNWAQGETSIRGERFLTEVPEYFQI